MPSNKKKKGSRKAVKKAAPKKKEEKVAPAAASAMDTQPDAEPIVAKTVQCKEYHAAEALAATDAEGAVLLYRDVLAIDDPDGELLKIKEQSVYKITTIYAGNCDAAVLKTLLVQIRPFLATIAKAKTAKIVRQIVEIVGRTIPDLELQASMCRDAIEWCKEEKRTFLKQRMESRLADLLFKQGHFKDSIKLINRLTKEVKKFDDKLLLVEINLLESRVYHRLENLPKSKGALTSARSNSASVYCPPLLQSQIDLQAGTLCAQEKDYKTSFSYFYEAFESYNTINYVPEATACLKYMLLAKIMCNQAEDVYSIVNGKAGVKFAGEPVQAMREVADAYKKRSIHAFQAVFKKYKTHLGDDPIINAHLTDLEGTLLEQNLIRLIEPFSRVQITHVAKLIDLPVEQVEHKLSEMILDKKFHGILDQGSNDLIVFDEAEADETYVSALATIGELSGVVDRLYNKAGSINA